MQVEAIDRYKASVKLSFPDERLEEEFAGFQLTRGRTSGLLALITLMLLAAGFAFLEFALLGVSSMLPLYAYAVIAVLALSIALFNRFNSTDQWLLTRVLIPGLLLYAVLSVTVFFSGYRLYHAMEIALLMIWLGSLNMMPFRFVLLIEFSTAAVFTTVAFVAGATSLKFSGLITIEIIAIFLALYLSYLLERMRRMIFLTGDALKQVFDRQENWAYTLIDLDMALSGILNFSELMGRLMENIRSVIPFDSSVYSSLEGKGPKPAADKVEGTLFKDDDNTLWSEDLLNRLIQSRQACVSVDTENSKGFLGKEVSKIKNYRIDIPLINDSNLIGVISLKRTSKPFDDLDLTASVSLASQAMLIYKRSEKSSQMSATLQKAISAKTLANSGQEIKVKRADPEGNAAEDADMDVTADQTSTEELSSADQGGTDETMVPSELVNKLKNEVSSVKKTITLLSRENAEHVAMDRYRTAAVEGEPLSLLLVEVDGLSSIREKDGDQAAYKVFAAVVKYVFSKINPDSDVLGRYGQNGFSILLPKVDMNAGEKFADMLRKHIEQSKFKTPYGERQATLSIGVAAITDETGNHEAMVKRADMALFVAKKNGRNCVKVRL